MHQTPGMPRACRSTGTPRGRKYTTYIAVNATSNPVNFSNHVWKYAAVMRSIHQLSTATAKAALRPRPISLGTLALDAGSSDSTVAFLTRPSAVTILRASLRPSIRSIAGSSSSHNIALPTMSRKTCPLMSCPPLHCPPIALHAACVMTSFTSPASTFLARSSASSYATC